MKTSLPKQGRFGDYGGRYIPETLVPAIEELEENYLKFKDDKNFKKELDYYLKYYAGRPTPLYFAKKMKKKRIIAETGAGQHGVATAMACACLGIHSEVYMGYKDTIRQKLNVFRMNLLGSKVHPVKSGSQTLKDAINEAIRDWITNVDTTY